MSLKEYPTLTALMAGREPGSVKVRIATWHSKEWCRPLRKRPDGDWFVMWCEGDRVVVSDESPWLLVSEDAPALDTLRLQIAGQLIAALHSGHATLGKWDNRHAYALAEADALIKAASEVKR